MFGCGLAGWSAYDVISQQAGAEIKSEHDGELHGRGLFDFEWAERLGLGMWNFARLYGILQYYVRYE
ncbi:hypothetical protein D3C71_1804570 [compost metagenome]